MNPNIMPLHFRLIYGLENTVPMFGVRRGKVAFLSG